MWIRLRICKAAPHPSHSYWGLADKPLVEAKSQKGNGHEMEAQL